MLDTGLQMLFGTPVALADDTPARQSLVSRPLVSQRGGDERLTNESGVGGLAGLSAAHVAAVLPALVAGIVQRPVVSISLVEQYGRVMIARVVPYAQVDPVLPLVMGLRSPGYLYWYRRYWSALMLLLGGFPTALRRVERMKRRLLMQLFGLGLEAREIAYFQTWLEHGSLGDYTLGE